MNNNPFVKITNISKKYPGNNESTLNNFSVEIYEGEVFALLGPSGCGKSTFLRIIAGFEEPDSGEIIIDGKNILTLPPYKRPINMMFQNYALFPHMNVEQNIAFGLQQEKINKNEIKDRVRDSLEMVGMLKLADRYPHQLSGGQQQRAALARSIVKRPKLLLLDEPLGSLDRKTRERTQMELIKIQDYLNMTFIIVTHEQDEAMSLSDRIAVMKDGGILQIGTPEEIYERPASRFVANFVGSINMFEGKITSCKNNNVSIYNEELNVNFTINDNTNYKIGRKVWFAIRPEELTICSNILENMQNSLIGIIIDIGFLGGEIFYHVQLENEAIVHVSVPTAARSKNKGLGIGKEAYITWDINDGAILTS